MEASPEERQCALEAERALRAYRKDIVRWNERHRSSLLKTVVVIVSMAFLVAVFRLVSIDTALGFALTVFAAAFLTALDIKTVPVHYDSILQGHIKGSEDWWTEWWWMALLGILILSALGLYFAGAYNVVAAMVLGFVTMIVLGQISNYSVSRADGRY